jgi:hypothetical protein
VLVVVVLVAGGVVRLVSFISFKLDVVVVVVDDDLNLLTTK